MYDPQGSPLLQGCRDNKGANLWRFDLRPQTSTPSDTEKDIQAFTVVTYVVWPLHASLQPISYGIGKHL